MNIAILLRQLGEWKSKIQYVKYKSKGIFAVETITYLGLISSIAIELDIDESEKSIDIYYVVDDNESTIVI